MSEYEHDAPDEFEPSTAHLNPRCHAQTRMVPGVRCVTRVVGARSVHTPVHTSGLTRRGCPWVH